MSRRINDIIRDLEKPFPQYEKTKTKGGQNIRFLPWTGVRRILDENAPGWHADVKEVKEVAGRIVATVTLYLDAEEGLIHREGTAQKLIPKDEATANQYGDPTKNACSDAFRRAAGMFGVGEYLRGKNQAFAPEQARHLAGASKAEPPPAVAKSAPPATLTPQQLALHAQAPSTGKVHPELKGKQDLIAVIDAEYARLKMSPSRIQAEETAEFQLAEWSADARLGASVAQLQNYLTRLKSYGPPERMVTTWNSDKFWKEARTLTTGEGFRLFTDDFIRTVVRKHTGAGGKADWAAAMAELVDAQREDAARAKAA